MLLTPWVGWNSCILPPSSPAPPLSSSSLQGRPGRVGPYLDCLEFIYWTRLRRWLLNRSATKTSIPCLAMPPCGKTDRRRSRKAIERCGPPTSRVKVIQHRRIQISVRFVVLRPCPPLWQWHARLAHALAPLQRRGHTGGGQRSGAVERGGHPHRPPLVPCGPVSGH